LTQAPLTIAFHIGAHKTATSHMQRSLKNARQVLAEKGVQYYGPVYFRQPGHSIQALFGFRTGAENGGAQRTAAAQLALMRRDGHRLVLSEENFIGPLNQPHGRSMGHRYKSAGVRLASLARAVGQDIDICLAVRRPTSFINSAYCQMLLGGRVQPVEMFQRRNPLSSVDWVDLVAQVRATSGVGTLTVWQYEYYHALFPQIMASLAGPVAGAMVAPRPKYINRGLSAAAVAHVMDHAGEVSAKDARRMFAVEDGHASFDGFAMEEHAISDASYARQIKAISQMDDVTFLRPDPA